MSAVQQSARAQPGSRAPTVRAVAKILPAVAISRITTRWLRWQCQLLSNVRIGMVFDASGLNPGQSIPVSAVVASVGSESQNVEFESPANENHHNLVAGRSIWQLPIPYAAKPLCVVLHIDALDDAQRAAADRLLRWGVQILRAWFADAYSGTNAEQAPVRSMLAQDSLENAAACWVDDLPSRTGAARVSIGWLVGGQARLLAISDVPTLDAKRSMPRAINAAINECVSQQCAIVYPHPDASTVRGEHAALHSGYGLHRILTLPLMHQGKAVGAVLFEFSNNTSASALDVNTINEELATVTPLLVTLSQRRPGIAMYLKQRAYQLVKTITQPASKTERWVSVALIAAVLGTVFFPFPHRVSLNGEIYGSDRQVLAATHNGYLKSVTARAGDVVSGGQVLATFDDLQLRLERDTWVSELTRLDAALVQAMTMRDRATVGRLRAQKSAAEAELNLTDHRLGEAEIIAPFDGILVSGDLDDRLGSSVTAGETLFQIASLNDYRLQLDVPEQQSARVIQGAIGEMRFAAFPSIPFSFSVESMVPIAVATEGANVFRVQAALQGDTSEIRPGMTGVAKVQVGHRSWLFRGVEFLSQRLRYWWWSIGV